MCVNCDCVSTWTLLISIKSKCKLKMKQIPTNALVIFGTLGRDSSVGIATCYGLDGPGIGTRLGQDFPHPQRPALEPNQPSIQKG